MTRATAILLSAAVLAWQAWNAAQGRFVHRYLAADVVASLILLIGSFWPRGRTADVILLAGYSAFSAIFFSATTGGLLVDGYNRTGTLLTSVGLVPCLAGAVVLAARLRRPDCIAGNGQARDSTRPA